MNNDCCRLCALSCELLRPLPLSPLGGPLTTLKCKSLAFKTTSSSSSSSEARRGINNVYTGDKRESQRAPFAWAHLHGCPSSPPTTTSTAAATTLEPATNNETETLNNVSFIIRDEMGKLSFLPAPSKCARQAAQFDPAPPMINVVSSARSRQRRATIRSDPIRSSLWRRRLITRMRAASSRRRPI